MGKTKLNATNQYTFVPRISTASKKLAARRLQQLDTGGLPHFMLDIKCKAKDLEPLAPIVSTAEKTVKPVQTFKWSEEQGELNIFPSGDDETAPSFPGPVLRTGRMNKQSEVFLDDSIFTFRPKVSHASMKIVENMGTDFMARQQQHLERQKKFVEQAGLPFNLKTHGENLSPINRFGQKVSKDKGSKENDDNDNLNSNSQEFDSPDSPGAETEDSLGEMMHSSLKRNKTTISSNLQRVLDGPYANGNPDMVLKHHKMRMMNHTFKEKLEEEAFCDFDDKDDTDTNSSFSRSKTMPTLRRPKLTRKVTALGSISSLERLKNAKEIAEKAIRNKKVFTIQGGYSAVRHSLRRRGWVEKFYKLPAPPKKTKKKRQKNGEDDDDENDDDDDDDTDDTDSDNDQPKIPPWEEDDGIYGIMSRTVRNVNPSFIWVLKRDVIDYRFLSKDQMVNHYVKAGSFTTKVGLCVNMRNVPWFEDCDPDSFYPRCYRLSHDEEKLAFIDDFRMTACISILKIVVNMYMEGGECDDERREKDDSEDKENEEPVPETKPFICTNPECTHSRPNMTTDNKCIHALEQEELEKKKAENRDNLTPPPVPKVDHKKRKKKRVIVPLKCLDRAIGQCEKYLMQCDHDDIDEMNELYQLSQAQWDELIGWYYQLVHENGIIPNIPNHLLGQVESILNRMKTKWPQLELDGVKNVWIVKPGAKSRGRGIVCYSRLEDMLKLVNSQVVRKDNKYVVQKYIERPLLIYNCKFDIRQWFLVTDWNPLTIWFYMDSYLRFCSQEFTLDSFDESIHLSNNAIQKHYKNGPRSSRLPDENMWSHEEFKDYLKTKKLGHIWDDHIYPTMKKSIVCALLTTQDIVEFRKASFELYGADFMLTEDYSPWLIEINSSPSMESSTAVTSRLCTSVLEDTIKVVIDRKYDKNCDIGRFELAYKQPLVTVPPYIGISLCAEGQHIKKPGWMHSRQRDQEQLFSPRKESKQVIFNDKVNPYFAETVLNNRSNMYQPQKTKRPHSDRDLEPGQSSIQKSSTSSAPVKKSYSHEPNDGQKEKKHSSAHKSVSSAKSPAASSNGNNESENDDSAKPEKIDAHIRIPHSPIIPKTSIYGSSIAPTTSYVVNPAGKKILSKTSVSTNYTIPNAENKEKPALTVSNVESTDLKSLKAQAKGVCQLIDSTWSRTCLECGNGMNLRLDGTNTNCKCQHDGIRTTFYEPLNVNSSRDTKNVLNQPKRGSSRPPSAVSMQSTGIAVLPQNVSLTSKTDKEKVAPQYPEGNNLPQRQLVPHYYGISNNLPRFVRRYLVHRQGIPFNSSSASYIVTSPVDSTMSIKSLSYPRN
ncbi:hypothetical protein ACJMK2_015997 [Sinanodonta woodiana]|uniref:ATP-grasp domain-containing protein n=1 Tax=Sinanodonta woodiana TaxID=1069815 RepID=A0ABD3UVN0_SINWO